MNDPVKTLARELYVADHLHQYASILVKNNKLEHSYKAYREKILANAPFEELSLRDSLTYQEQAIRLLKPSREPSPLTIEELKMLTPEEE